VNILRYSGDYSAEVYLHKNVRCAYFYDMMEENWRKYIFIMGIIFVLLRRSLCRGLLTILNMQFICWKCKMHKLFFIKTWKKNEKLFYTSLTFREREYGQMEYYFFFIYAWRENCERILKCSWTKNKGIRLLSHVGPLSVYGGMAMHHHGYSTLKEITV